MNDPPRDSSLPFVGGGAGGRSRRRLLIPGLAAAVITVAAAVASYFVLFRAPSHGDLHTGREPGVHLGTGVLSGRGWRVHLQDGEIKLLPSAAQVDDGMLVELRRGRAMFRIDKRLARQGALAVHAGRFEISATGTLFSVTRDEHDLIGVDVIEGEVVVRVMAATAPSWRLSAGRRWSSDQAPPMSPDGAAIPDGDAAAAGRQPRANPTVPAASPQ